jgi:hypothetical protein
MPLDRGVMRENYPKPGVTLVYTGFLRVDLTVEMYERALIKAEEIGRLNNSIREGTGNLVGALGEEIVVYALGAIPQNTYHHDVLWCGRKFEVKSKDRTSRPQQYFDGSVAATNTRQRTDYYLHCSLFRPWGTEIFTQGYICGFIEKDRYYKLARFLRKGETEGSNDFIVQADCFNVAYSDMYTFEPFLESQ